MIVTIRLKEEFELRILSLKIDNIKKSQLLGNCKLQLLISHWSPWQKILDPWNTQWTEVKWWHLEQEWLTKFPYKLLFSLSPSLFSFWMSLVLTLFIQNTYSFYYTYFFSSPYVASFPLRYYSILNKARNKISNIVTKLFQIFNQYTRSPWSVVS